MAKRGSSKKVASSSDYSHVVHTWRDAPRAEGESFEGRIGLTIPDQVKPVAQIVDEVTRGITDFPTYDLFFLNDDEIPNFEQMSKIEQLTYAQDLRYLIASRKDKLKQLTDAGEEVTQEDYPKLTPRQPAPPPSSDEERTEPPQGEKG